MRRPPVTKGHELASEIGQHIGRVRRLFWLAAQPHLDRFSESSFSWQVMIMVVRHGPISQTEIADLTVQHPAGVSRALDDLEKRGLVRRSRDAADRRRVLVAPTDAGLQHHDKIWPEAVAALEEILAPLTTGERKQLRTLLSRVGTKDA